MININKVQPDPQPLQDFKNLTQNSGPDKSCNYDLFRQPELNNYKKALLEEQHFLCAYCNRNLDEFSEEAKLYHLKIEHWYPQKLCKIAPDYNTPNGNDVAHENMLIVCPGQNANPDFTHCDSSRTDGSTLTIKPQDPAYKFEEVFRYEGGKLISQNEAIQFDVDSELNLNEDIIILRRNIVLNQFIKVLPPKHTINKQALIARYSTPNRENRLKEYFTIILHFIINNLN